MRFITVHLKCDWDDCTVVGEDGSEDVVEKTVAIDNRKPRTFTLCKQHLANFEDMILPLMQAGTAVSDEPSPLATAKKTKAECKVPDCGRTLVGRTGMAQHVTRTHDFASLDEYEAQYGPINGG